jgi:hypothetical protein
MANEITYASGSGNYSVDFRVMADSILPALYENARLILGFLKRKSLSSFHSISERFPKDPKLVAASIADGVDMQNSPYTPDGVTLTVGEQGLLLTITDLNRMSTIKDFGAYGTEMGEAIAEKMMTDITALFSGFSTSVGVSAASLTEAQFKTARRNLIINRHKGPYVAVLYPTQLDHLVEDIGTTVAALVGSGGPSLRSETNDLANPIGNDMGMLHQTRIITSTTVPTANAGADSAGGVFAANRALALVDKWATRTEMERDISLRAEEIAATAAYGVGELDDTAGVAIVTDR